MTKRRSFLLIMLFTAVIFSVFSTLSVKAQLSSFSSGQSAAEYEILADLLLERMGEMK